MKAIVAVLDTHRSATAIGVHEPAQLPRTTRDVQRTIGDGLAEDGEVIVRADERAEGRHEGTADGSQKAGHELRWIACGEGGVGHGPGLIQPHLVLGRLQHGQMPLGAF